MVKSGMATSKWHRQSTDPLLPMDQAPYPPYLVLTHTIKRGHILRLGYLDSRYGWVLDGQMFGHLKPGARPRVLFWAKIEWPCEETESTNGDEA